MERHASVVIVDVEAFERGHGGRESAWSSVGLAR